MSFVTGGYYKILIFIFIVISVTAVFPRLSNCVYPYLPAPSPEYDCDDCTLSTYRHFQRLGIMATPILGNLSLEDEDYMECDHVWLLVESGENIIAYDWGEPKLDRQHYEGYTVELDYLFYAISDDIKESSIHF